LQFSCSICHWRNFTLKSGGDQWRRQDLVSGGTTIEAPCGVKYREGCPLPSRLGGLGERRELPQRGPIYFYCIRLADILNCFESLYVLSEKKDYCASHSFLHTVFGC